MDGPGWETWLEIREETKLAEAASGGQVPARAEGTKSPRAAGSRLPGMQFLHAAPGRSGNLRLGSN